MSTAQFRTGSQKATLEMPKVNTTTMMTTTTKTSTLTNIAPHQKARRYDVPRAFANCFKVSYCRCITNVPRFRLDENVPLKH